MYDVLLFCNKYLFNKVSKKIDNFWLSKETSTINTALVVFIKHTAIYYIILQKYLWKLNVLLLI